MIISSQPFSIMLLLFALIIAIIAEAFILPRIIHIEKRKKDYLISDDDKSQTYSLSGLAGISIFPIMLFVISICALIASFGFNMEFIHESRPIHIASLACGCLLIWGAGLIDNISGESYKKKKVIIQLLAAIILVFGEVYINNFNGLFGIQSIPSWVGIPFTIALVMFITNAINQIDDNGIICGISGVALIAFGYFFLQRGLFFYALICTILTGILIPFFYYNVFKSTSKLFIGNTGSLTLGYLLAFLGVRYAMDTDANYEQLTSPVIISLSVMFIPLFDALRVMLVRICKGKSPFQSDRRHIHHKLLDLGMSEKKVMVYLVVCAVILIILNINIVKFLNINAVLTIDIILSLIFIQVLNFQKRRKETN